MSENILACLTSAAISQMEMGNSNMTIINLTPCCLYWNGTDHINNGHMWRRKSFSNICDKLDTEVSKQAEEFQCHCTVEENAQQSLRSPWGVDCSWLFDSKVPPDLLLRGLLVPAWRVESGFHTTLVTQGLSLQPWWKGKGKKHPQLINTLRAGLNDYIVES